MFLLCSDRDVGDREMGDYGKWNWNIKVDLSEVVWRTISHKIAGGNLCRRLKERESEDLRRRCCPYHRGAQEVKQHIGQTVGPSENFNAYYRNNSNASQIKNRWMNKRMNIWMNVWMNERMNEPMNERMNEWMNGTNEWTYEWMNEWMNEWNEWRNKWTELASWEILLVYIYSRLTHKP